MYISRIILIFNFIFILLLELVSHYQPKENRILNVDELRKEKDSFNRLVENFSSPGRRENPSNNYLIPRE